jgi:hypothetical protein
MLPKSIHPDTLRNVGAFALVVIVLLSGIVLWTVQKMVMRVVVLGLLIGIGVFIWYERDALQDCGPPNCSCKILSWDVSTASIPGCEPAQPS